MPKISALPAAVSLSISDLLVTVNSGVTKKITDQQLATLYNNYINIPISQVTGLQAALTSIIDNVQKTGFNFAVDEGIADAYIVTLDPSPSSYANGLAVAMYTPAVNATHTPTINVNGLGIKNIRNRGGYGINLRDIGDTISYMIFNQASDEFLLINPCSAATIGTDFPANRFNYCIDTGIADAYVGTIEGIGTFPTDGTLIWSLISNDNTGPATFNVVNADGTPTGNFNIDVNGGPLVGGELLNGSVYGFMFKSTNKWQLINPSGSGGGGGVTPAQVQEWSFNTGTDSGIADAYVVALTPAITGSVPDGTVVSFFPNFSNSTTIPTLDVGSGANPMVSSNFTGTARPNDINSNTNCVAVWRANSSTWQILNPMSYMTENFYGDSGSADAYVIALNPSTPAYYEGLTFWMSPSFTNTTTTPTLNAGAGALVIQNLNQTPINAGDIQVGVPAQFIVHVNSFMLINPGGNTVTPTQIQNQTFTYSVSTGAGDSYTVALSPSVSSYVNGLSVWMLPNFNNSGPVPTLDAGAGGAGIVNYDGSNLASGDLTTTVVAHLIYANGVFNLQNPANEVTCNNLSSQKFTYGVDNGIADAYVANLLNNDAAVTDGKLFWMLPLNTNNTTTPTLSILPLSAPFPIVGPTGGALTAGVIQAGVPAQFMFLGSSFYLLNPGGGVTAAQVQSCAFNHGNDSGITDAYVVALTPPDIVNGVGTECSFIPNSTNTSTTPTIDLGYGVYTIVLSGGNPLVAGDIVAGQLSFLKQDITSMVLINPVISGSSVTIQRQVQGNAYNFSPTDIGTGDNYAIVLNPPFSGAPAPNQGTTCIFLPGNSNTTSSPTIDVGSGATAITVNGFPPSPGDILVNQIAQLTFDGSSWLLQNPKTVRSMQVNAGNPNGPMGGSLYDLCLDITNSFMYWCSTAGAPGAAAWTKVVM